MHVHAKAGNLSAFGMVHFESSQSLQFPSIKSANEDVFPRKIYAMTTVLSKKLRKRRMLDLNSMILDSIPSCQPFMPIHLFRLIFQGFHFDGSFPWMPIPSSSVLRRESPKFCIIPHLLGHLFYGKSHAFAIVLRSSHLWTNQA